MSIIQRICEVGSSVEDPIPYSMVWSPTKTDSIWFLREEGGVASLYDVPNPDVTYLVGVTTTGRTTNVSPQLFADYAPYVLGHIMAKDFDLYKASLGTEKLDRLMQKSAAFLELFRKYTEVDPSAIPLLKCLEEGNIDLSNFDAKNRKEAKICLQWSEKGKIVKNPLLEKTVAQQFWRDHHLTDKVSTESHECFVCGQDLPSKAKLQSADLVTNNIASLKKYGAKTSSDSINVQICAQCDDNSRRGLEHLLQSGYSTNKGKSHFLFFGKNVSDRLLPALFETSDDVTAKDLVNQIWSKPEALPQKVSGTFLHLTRMAKEPYSIESERTSDMEKIVDNLVNWNDTLSLFGKSRPSFHDLKRGMIPTGKKDIPFCGNENKFYRDLLDMALFGARVSPEWIQVLYIGSLRGHKYEALPYFTELYRRRNMENKTMNAFYHLGRATAYVVEAQKNVNSGIKQTIDIEYLRLIQRDPKDVIIQLKGSRVKWFFTKMKQHRGDFGMEGKKDDEVYQASLTWDEEIALASTHSDIRKQAALDFIRGLGSVHQEKKEFFDEKRKDGANA